MTASTRRCPATTAIVLAPLMAVLLALEVLTWVQQALFSVQYWSPTSVVLCLSYAVAGPAAMTCSLLRRRPGSSSGWRRLLRMETATLVIAVPLALIIICAIAGGAVI
jgi:hypothetical protein